MDVEYKNRPKTLSGQIKQAWIQHQFSVLVGFGVRCPACCCLRSLPSGAAWLLCSGVVCSGLLPLPPLPPSLSPSSHLPLTPNTQIMVVLFFVYHFFSDGDFSFLMTLGSLLVLFGFGLLVVKAVLTGKLSTVSFKALQAYALVFSARLCSILFYEGYLPYDKSGDWFYQAVEVSALLLCAGLLLCMQLRLVKLPSERASLDTFEEFAFRALGLPPGGGVLLLVLPALALALVLHPSLNNNFFTDVAWTFALYLEAVAIYPQLHIFNHKNLKEEVEPLELNYVFFLAVARLLHFVFWVSSYQELNDKTSASLNRKFREWAQVGVACPLSLALTHTHTRTFPPAQQPATLWWAHRLSTLPCSRTFPSTTSRQPARPRATCPRTSSKGPNPWRSKTAHWGGRGKGGGSVGSTVVYHCRFFISSSHASSAAPLLLPF